MSIRNRLLLAGVILACSGAGVRAADGPPLSVYSSAPAALAAGPTVMPVESGSCAPGVSRFTAGWRGVPSCDRSSCDTGRFHRQKPPYVVNLCPGACFGYFQTQWRKWDEVCPLPYGSTVTGQPVPYLPPTELLPQDKKNGIPPPRVVDPKMPPPPSGVGALPKIPPYPGAGRY